MKWLIILFTLFTTALPAINAKAVINCKKTAQGFIDTIDEYRSQVSEFTDFIATKTQAQERIPKALKEDFHIHTHTTDDMSDPTRKCFYGFAEVDCTNKASKYLPGRIRENRLNIIAEEEALLEDFRTAKTCAAEALVKAEAAHYQAKKIVNEAHLKASCSVSDLRDHAFQQLQYLSSGKDSGITGIHETLEACLHADANDAANLITRLDGAYDDNSKRKVRFVIEGLKAAQEQALHDAKEIQRLTAATTTPTTKESPQAQAVRVVEIGNKAMVLTVSVIAGTAYLFYKGITKLCS